MSNRDLKIRILDDEPPRRPTAVESTEAMVKSGEWGAGRINQARAFLKRAKKSDARRRMEKATRKRNRR